MKYISEENIRKYFNRPLHQIFGKATDIVTPFHLNVSVPTNAKVALNNGGDGGRYKGLIEPASLLRIRDMASRQFEDEYNLAMNFEAELMTLFLAYDNADDLELQKELFPLITIDCEDARGILKRHHDLFRNDTQEGKFERVVIAKVSETLDLCW